MRWMNRIGVRRRTHTHTHTGSVLFSDRTNERTARRARRGRRYPFRSCSPSHPPPSPPPPTLQEHAADTKQRCPTCSSCSHCANQSRRGAGGVRGLGGWGGGERPRTTSCRFLPPPPLGHASSRRGTGGRFLSRLWSDLTRSLLCIKNELGPTYDVLRTDIG